MSDLLNTSFGIDRRRRLRLSLESLLPPDQLWHALWVWEREFATTSPFDISGYANRIASELGIPESSKALLDQITRGIQAPADGLPADPIAEMQRHAFQPLSAAPSPPMGSAAPTIPLSPPEAVFNRFLETLLASLGKRVVGVGPDGPRDQVAALVRSVGGRAPGWIEDPQAKLTGLSPSQMSTVINGLYVWTCEELGPVAADPLFGSAVRSTEEMPEAANFSPRQFL